MSLARRISIKIVNYMAENNIIPVNEVDFYIYCYEFVLDLLIFNLSVIVLGFLLGHPLLALLYIITLTPTKMLAGGAHANSRSMCSIISYTITLAVLLATQISFHWNDLILLIIFLLAIISIIIFSPVETPNKKFPAERKRTLKKYSFFYSSFLVLLYLILLYKNFTQYIFLMTLCVIIIAVNQYIGIIINRKSKEKEIC